MSISVASSQKNTLPSTPSTTAVLYAHATVIATPIRVIIPGSRSDTSSTRPVRKGHPP